MAIDNAEKRKSISSIVIVSPGVTSNAAPDVEWRLQSGYTYSGITITSAPAFDVDLTRYVIKIDDVGYQLDQDDLGWLVDSQNIERYQLDQADLGWNVSRNDLSWNIRKDD